MKNIYTLFIGLLFSFMLHAQEADSIVINSDIDKDITVMESDTSTNSKTDMSDIELDVMSDTVVDVDSDSTHTHFNFDDDVKTDTNIWDLDWGLDWDEKNIFKDKKGKFKGHWAGIEFGWNNYVDEDFSISRSTETEFMDLNTSRSWNINANFAQYSLALAGDQFGLLSGLGIEWSNYHFSNSGTIVKNTDTRYVESSAITGTIKSNRFQSTYLTIPLLLELQIMGDKPRKERVYISSGVIAGIKIGSNTKFKISETGGTRTETNESDFYLQPFRYGLTGRIGYKLVKLYLNYYLTPLFIDERGPVLYPLAMGFSITF